MKRSVLDKKHLGEILLRVRRRAGLTQKELEEKTGINASAISRYERGKIRLGSDNLQKVCDATGYSSDQFIQDAWALSREGGSPRQAVEIDPASAFPQAELERIYDESATEGKSLYLRTCRALFDALWKAPRPR
ncbi:MAG: helix-turn-helix domain-containing protein [Thermoanaerobaculia bacterium]